MWILNAVATTGTRREIENARETVFGKELAQRIRVLNIQPVELKSVVLELIKSMLLQRRVVVVIDVVDTDNAMTGFKELGCDS